MSRRYSQDVTSATRSSNSDGKSSPNEALSLRNRTTVAATKSANLDHVGNMDDPTRTPAPGSGGSGASGRISDRRGRRIPELDTSTAPSMRLTTATAAQRRLRRLPSPGEGNGPVVLEAIGGGSSSDRGFAMEARTLVAGSFRDRERDKLRNRDNYGARSSSVRVRRVRNVDVDSGTRLPRGTEEMADRVMVDRDRQGSEEDMFDYFKNCYRASSRASTTPSPGNEGESSSGVRKNSPLEDGSRESEAQTGGGGGDLKAAALMRRLSQKRHGDYRRQSMLVPSAVLGAPGAGGARPARRQGRRATAVNNLSSSPSVSRAPQTSLNPSYGSTDASGHRPASRLNLGDQDRDQDLDPDDPERASEESGSPTSPKPVVCRVRNFSLTPDGGLINRGDSFRLKYRRQSNAVPTTSLKPNLHTTTTTGEDDGPRHRLVSDRGSIGAYPKRIDEARDDGRDVRRQSAARKSVTSTAEPRRSISHEPIIDLIRETGGLGLNSEQDGGMIDVGGVLESEVEDEEENTYFVLVLGAPTVGKTSILAQFTSSEFGNAYEDSSDREDEIVKELGMEIKSFLQENTTHPSPGDDDDRDQSLDTGEEDDTSTDGILNPSSPDLQEKSISITVDNEESRLNFIKITINDHESLDDLYDFENEGADGFIIVYSVSDKNSFDCAIDILHSLKQLKSPKAIILVGNKCDLVRAREITSEEAVERAKSYGCKFIETSAGLSLNIDNLLVGILTQIRIKVQRSLTAASRNLPNDNEDGSLADNRASGVYLRDMTSPSKGAASATVKKVVKKSGGNSSEAKGRGFGSKKARQFLHKFFRTRKRVPPVTRQMSKSCENLYV